MWQYLNRGIQSHGENAAANSFETMEKSLLSLGFSANAKKTIYKLIAAILHLGNIHIEKRSVDEMIEIRGDSVSSLEQAAGLMNTSADYLKDSLLTKRIKIGSEDEMYVLLYCLYFMYTCEICRYNIYLQNTLYYNI